MGMFLKGHYGRKGLISRLRENIQLGEQDFLVLISLSHLHVWSNGSRFLP